jgi:ribosomal protein L37AE/L43A
MKNSIMNWYSKRKTKNFEKKRGVYHCNDCGNEEKPLRGIGIFKPKCPKCKSSKLTLCRYLSDEDIKMMNWNYMNDLKEGAEEFNGEHGKSAELKITENILHEIIYKD